MRPFQAVIFDMDGLLVDTERYFLEAFKAVCQKLGIECEQHVIYKCIGTNQKTTDEILAAELSFDGTIEDFREYWETEYRRLVASKRSLLKDGAVELLTFIQSINCSIGLATSTDTTHATARLQKEAIHHFFDQITGGDQVSQSKPHPAIYLKAASKFNCAPENCLALEDSENGVMAALTAGMHVVQIPDVIMPEPEFQKRGQTILPNLHSVIAYLSS